MKFQLLKNLIGKFWNLPHTARAVLLGFGLLCLLNLLVVVLLIKPWGLFWLGVLACVTALSYGLGAALDYLLNPNN